MGGGIHYRPPERKTCDLRLSLKYKFSNSRSHYLLCIIEDHHYRNQHRQLKQNYNEYVVWR
jgi:hypothetical protein